VIFVIAISTSIVFICVVVHPLHIPLTAVIEHSMIAGSDRLVLFIELSERDRFSGHFPAHIVKPDNRNSVVVTPCAVNLRYSSWLTDEN
jgi:hypothetical protein